MHQILCQVRSFFESVDLTVISYSSVTLTGRSWYFIYCIILFHRFGSSMIVLQRLGSRCLNATVDESVLLSCVQVCPMDGNKTSLLRGLPTS